MSMFLNIVLKKLKPRLYAQFARYVHMSINCVHMLLDLLFKAAYSVTMNIFRKFLFSF